MTERHAIARKAAREILFAAGFGGYGPELSDDNPLVVRATAVIERACETAAFNAAEECRSDAENLAAMIRHLVADPHSFFVRQNAVSLIRRLGYWPSVTRSRLILAAIRRKQMPPPVA